jgi:hypothetical protein
VTGSGGEIEGSRREPDPRLVPCSPRARGLLHARAGGWRAAPGALDLEAPANEFVEVAACLLLRFYMDVTSSVRRAYPREGNLLVVTFSNARFEFRHRVRGGLLPGEGARVVFDEARRVREAVVYGIPVPLAGWTPSE